MKLSRVWAGFEGGFSSRIVDTCLSMCRYVFSKTEFHVLILGIDKEVKTSGLRPVWEKYFEEAHTVIYVIDVASHHILKIQYLLWKNYFGMRIYKEAPSSDSSQQTGSFRGSVLMNSPGI